jgi:transcriptional regulator with XRE-family HTH domain
MDDAREPAGMSDDEIITSLFAAAERTRLPHEPAYDEPAMLRRFGAWLEANTDAVARHITGIEREPSRPGRIQHRPSPPGPARYPLLQTAVGGYAAMPAALAEVVVLPLGQSAPAGPTVQRLVLGSQLHRLRESRGITAEQAAEAIRGSHSKISRMEHGRVGFKERDVGDLLTLYGVTDAEERAALLNLAREANTLGWWHAYSDILPTWLEPYVGLEAAASIIRTYQVQHVPGLLQTEGYARALIRQDSAATEEEIARRGELRASRQEILRRPDSPQLWIVVDEGALRRHVGTREVIREQLRFLIEMADHTAVTLQIMPFTAGAHPSMGGPFTILCFAEPDLPDVVYIEELTSAIYLGEPAEVSSYLHVMEQLCLQAEPAARTKKVISDILADI